MEVRWEYLTPPEFKKLVQEEKVCILPIGSLERHGDHMPFGTDALVAHDIAVRVARKEPCVVFPPYWFGEVHCASCFTGTVNFPTEELCRMLQTLVDQIAQNGFRKILILNAHGGNQTFLQHFMMTQLSREVDYALYLVFYASGKRFKALDIWDEPMGGHADENETSLMMAIAPDCVKLEQQTIQEPILPKCDLAQLDGVYTALWWYDQYPENVTGMPSYATPEKGEIALNAAAEDVADKLRAIKEDTQFLRLQKEFYRRRREIKDV